MIIGKSYSAKPADIQKQWVLIDAENLVLGRLAAEVAKILRGKHKATFTPHMDMGDNVIIINARKVKLTGKKLNQKKFFWHTGHPGGIKEILIGKVLNSRFPERAIIRAVERMLPKDSPLARQQLRNLKVYADAEHPHAPQNPKTLDIGGRNKKNKKA